MQHSTQLNHLFYSGIAIDIGKLFDKCYKYCTVL